MGRLDRDSERLAPITPRVVVAWLILGAAGGFSGWSLLWAVIHATEWLLRGEAR